jgi:tripartite-type tricarboxylate transporter receptor subunit TctC
MPPLRNLLPPCLLLLAALAANSQAQDYPARPVKIIVTFTAGGAADATARIFADKLAVLWNQGVVVENRPGAGGSIGAEAVFRAAPDGYTLLLATNTHIINHVLIPKLAFDYTKDFTPLGLVSSAPMVLAVNPALAATNLRELTQLLRTSPGKIPYASCNVASPHHFAMAIYVNALKLDTTHIPYKGCTPAVTDTLAGQVNIVAASIPAVVGFARQGTLRPIALLSSKRSAALPHVPTAGESGIPELKGYALDNYYGFMAPPGLPPAIQKKLEDDIRAVSAMADTRTRYDAAGLEPLSLGAADMMKLIREDAQKYAAAAKQANIKME